MLEDKISKFLEEVQDLGIELSEETAFVCEDGVVILTPSDTGLQIRYVSSVIEMDYTLDISDEEVKLWSTEKEIEKEMRKNGE